MSENNSARGHYGLKLLLQRTNIWLSIYNTHRESTIWQSVYKWNYNHNLLKNLLKLTNKCLRTLNHYHLFKVDYLYMLVGMTVGLVVSQTETQIDNLQRLEFKPMVENTLIEQVLRNKQIQLKLKQTLHSNILTNEDILTNIHFLLLNKALLSQTQTLSRLIKSVILSALQSDQIHQLALTQTLKALQNNKQLIFQSSYVFLSSEHLQSIIKTQLAPLIVSQPVQQLLTKEVKQLVNSQLKNDNNLTNLYHYLKQKIIF